MEFAFRDDSFGRSVAIDGDKMLVGANGHDPRLLSSAGEVFVYHLADVQLPETGFAPVQVTLLAAQPANFAYQGYGDLWLEIPALGVEMSIVGVPKSGNGWDVR